MYTKAQAVELAMRKLVESFPIDQEYWNDYVVPDWIVDAIIEASLGSFRILPKHHEPVVKNPFE